MSEHKSAEALSNQMNLSRSVPWLTDRIIVPQTADRGETLAQGQPTTFAQEFARVVPYLSASVKFKEAFSQRGFHVKCVAEVPGQAAVIQFEDESICALHYQAQTWRVFLDGSPTFVPEDQQPITGAWLDAPIGTAIKLAVLLDEVKLVDGQWGKYVVWKGQHLDHALRLDADHTIVINRTIRSAFDWPVGEVREVSGRVAAKELWGRHRQTRLDEAAVGPVG
jgi:hypothetical protein